MKIVGSGIDTLVLGFMIENYVDVDDFKMLSEAKRKAGERQFNIKGSSVTWFGVEFSVSANGASGYEWVLRNDDVKVCIAREARGGSIMPEVYVTFSSQYLWCEGVDAAVKKFDSWLRKWVVIKDTKVSRCDLCIDLAMPFPIIDLKSEVVTRARRKVEYSEFIKTEHYVSGKHDTGYRIGSGAILARIYDKTEEIVTSQKEWFRDIWLIKGWDVETSVIRCEFQLRRKFLKEMSVNTFEELKERIADIWRYCTHDWIRICDTGSVTNQGRWECKDFWKIIQDSYSLFGQAYGVLRMKIKKIRYDHLMKQAEGVIITACAILASGVSNSEAVFNIKQELKEFLSSDDFLNEVIERKALVGNIEKPHTHLVDEAIKMGAEIESIDLDW